MLGVIAGQPGYATAGEKDRLLREALAASPSDSRLLEQFKRMVLKRIRTMADPSARIDYLRDALEAAPRTAEFYFNLSLVYIETGEVEKGLSAMKSAIALDPARFPENISGRPAARPPFGQPVSEEKIVARYSVIKPLKGCKLVRDLVEERDIEYEILLDLKAGPDNEAALLEEVNADYDTKLVYQIVRGNDTVHQVKVPDDSDYLEIIEKMTDDHRIESARPDLYLCRFTSVVKDSIGVIFNGNTYPEYIKGCMRRFGMKLSKMYEQADGNIVCLFRVLSRKRLPAIINALRKQDCVTEAGLIKIAKPETRISEKATGRPKI